MAENYPIPPWLTPRVTPAEEYGQSVRQAAQQAAAMQMQSQRLQQESAATAMEISARQQEAEQRHQLEIQQMAQDKALKDAQIGLRTQEIQQGQQALNMQAQTAARKFAAQNAFAQEVGDATDPEKVTAALIKHGGDMGLPGTAIAAALRNSTRTSGESLPSTYTDPKSGRQFAKIPTETGNRWQLMTEPTDQLQRSLMLDQIKELERQRDRLDTAEEKDPTTAIAERLISKDPKSAAANANVQRYSARRKQMQDLDKQIEDLRAQAKGGASKKEIHRKTKDGRIAVFDADTKKFLRYADAQ